MGSASKEKMRLTRAEAAERLRALATHVEQGLILLGAEMFKVPEEVRLEIKAGKDELELDLQWKPSALEERSEEEQPVRAEEHAPHR